jgi:hypothetical protein
MRNVCPPQPVPTKSSLEPEQAVVGKNDLNLTLFTKQVTDAIVKGLKFLIL